MEISDVYKIIESFKKMNLEELNCQLTNIYKIKKNNEEQYNDLVEQLFFIISELHKEIERKLPPNEIDTDTLEPDTSSDEDHKLDIRLIDVYSDEE
jgi:hypothetical protein